MKVTIFGTGYVGLVTGACLADVGHQVMCVDIDAGKVERLQQGIIPIYEPGLEALVRENAGQGRLQFTTSAQEGAVFGTIQIIAVGTPPDEDGSADLQYVLAVADSIGRHMPADRIVVDKSTVPVGTADKVKARIQAALDARGVDFGFDVVSNPEFLKEGAAVADCMRPDRIVIGTSSASVEQTMRELYAPFNRNHERIIVMDVRSAELAKYAANAMLATKISFMNELANIAERLGADIENVRHGIGSDPRIGYHFIYAGCGYGGSCFPKDVQALARTAAEVGYDASLLGAVEAVNRRQKQQLFKRICDHFGGEDKLAGLTFALWGLAFKPNTDDMRAAPSRTLMEALWKAGARVQAFDPESMEETQHIYGYRDDLALMGTKEAVLRGADALVICTEWKAFRVPDFEALGMLKNQLIFDGRNLYDPVQMAQKGWTYYGVGRGESCVKIA
ncbi:UDP-glucose dehydrogenase family protein [Telluria beijingensis]|uniref:UDP-glucose dehydrogenase family protein n=1 Tax=Telluria beijingensis TaxID=3068633 RepID=UPI002795F169|nr:UDP-glucose/GDP-mannose dehydrogenase family protein [Massilia sp. REN29]